MPRFFRWTWRAIQGVATPLRYSWGKRGMIASAGALLGPGGAALIAALVPAFKTWLLAHWTHWGFVGAGVLFVSAFIALIGQEKRLDDMTVVRFLEPRATSKFQSIINGLGPRGSLRDVLTIEVRAHLRHEGLNSTSAGFPVFQLLERVGCWWRPLRAELHEPGWHCPGLHLPGMRVEIPASTAFDVELFAHFTLPAAGAAFPSRDDLGVRITIDVLRQLPVVLDAALPKPVVPPGDPAAPP